MTFLQKRSGCSQCPGKMARTSHELTKINLNNEKEEEKSCALKFNNFYLILIAWNIYKKNEKEKSTKNIYTLQENEYIEHATVKEEKIDEE